MSDGDEPRHQRWDAAPIVPVFAGAVALLAAAAGMALAWWMPDHPWILGVAGVSGLLGVGAACAAMVAALAQLAFAWNRSQALPMTALAGSIFLLAAASALVAVEVALVYTARQATPAINGFTSVPITAPWTSLSLPIGASVVIYSDATTITMVDAARNAAQLEAGYDLAIRRAGWVETFRDHSNGMFIRTYTMNGKTLTFAAMDSTGMATIALTQI